MDQFKPPKEASVRGGLTFRRKRQEEQELSEEQSQRRADGLEHEDARRRKWLTLHSLCFANRVNGASSHYGPYPTQRDAIRAAVDAAHVAGLEGLNGQVLLQDQMSIEWTYGKDPYPPRSSDYL